MRYSILGFNQAKVLETNLDLTDLIILQYIEQACGSPKMKHIITDEEQTLVWIYHAKFHEDLPILDMSESTLKNRLSKLKKDGYIQSQTITNPNIKGSCTYYGLTELTADLLYTADDVIVDETTYCQKYVVDRPRTAKSTSDNKLIGDSKLKKGVFNKLNTTEGEDNYNSHSSLFDVIAEKPKRSRKKSRYENYEEIIMKYTNNIILQEKLREYLKLRVEDATDKGKQYYPNQLKGVLNELDRLKAPTEEVIKIVERSISNNWAHFYPLKDNNKSIQSAPTEKGVTSQHETEEEYNKRMASAEKRKKAGEQAVF